MPCLGLNAIVSKMHAPPPLSQTTRIWAGLHKNMFSVPKDGRHAGPVHTVANAVPIHE